MSTLGTFAKYGGLASFARGKKKTSGQGELNLQPEKVIPRSTSSVNQNRMDTMAVLQKNAQKPSGLSTQVAPEPKKVVANMPYKSKRRVANGKKTPEGFDKMQKLRGIKNRNLLIGGGLGLAGLGTIGAIAYNNRDSARRSEMSFGSAFANFADMRSPEKIAADKLKADASIAKKKKLISPLTQTGNADADSAIKLVRDESRKNRRKEIGKVQKQRGFESAADKGNAYKNAKGGEYIARTLATAGSPERALIAQGKRNQNGFVKGLAETAENIGKAGYKEGATGLRKAGNAIAGRTMIGKGVRLGAAGIGLSAIGGAMKRNRQERG